MSRLTNSNTWNDLKNHHRQMKECSLRDLFQDSNRFLDFSIESDDFLLDFSKNIIDQQTMNLLFKLATESKIKNEIQDMFSAKEINWTEKRSVLHTALRDKSKTQILINNKDIKFDIKKSLDKIKLFSSKVRDGIWRGSTGKKIKYIVNIGIGGSDLGPNMVCDALAYYNDGPSIHFVSNIDASDISETLKKINPEKTLFLIASKTFTTLETMTNANTAKLWLTKALGESSVSKHFVAMSTNIPAVIKFGIDKSNIFTFWDYVGGRYSSWSSIGLSIAISIGYERFDQFLIGGYEMDCHFRENDLDQNLPVILALIGIWYNNFFKTETHAILPYDHYLTKFSAHIQQLDMESNGKYIDKDNSVIDYTTGPIIWGQPGTNGQHAFYQLIHQGTKLIPCDFIGFKQSLNPIGDHHDKLMANFFAQTKALAFGLTEQEIIKGLNFEDLSNAKINNIIPHKIFTGNRPTNTILIDKLTPKSLGKLLALYEHKVFVQGVIWRINSFDQWGVELGKNLANHILSSITKDDIFKNDSSTSGLLKKYKKH
jgi:glucose-6-phosphate isomerase